MSHPILTLTTGCQDVEPGELVLIEATGREAMSTIYEYELTFETQRDGGLPLSAIDGLLSHTCFIMMEGAGTIEVHGMLRKIQLLGSNETSPVTYKAWMVPRLWNTTRVFRSRIFQDMNVQEIVDAVLADSGLEAEWWLNEDYPKSEYLVQYEETDFNFISRRLEHWGLFYFFHQSPDGEQLVIADNDRPFEPHPDYELLTFNPRLGRSGVPGTVQALGATYRGKTGGVAVREYNWRTPATGLFATQEADTRAGFGAHWLYGDHFKDNDEGALIARIRAEQELNTREELEGVCSVPALAPGNKFELGDCPLPDMNITFLVTRVEPRIGIIGDAEDESYQYRFTAVPLTRDDPEPVPYRSQREAPKPVIHGFMHGFVDGESASTAAPIDDQGRYRIVLPLDSVAALGGRATRWIRMIQPSTGSNYGMHFPLHMGTEVAIIHLDGDPDRPVILGSIPHRDTASPVVQQDATKSRIRTRSGIEFEFEDDS